MAQQLLNGIFLGSIYALFAVGYTLVFGVLDVLNLAHSAVFTLGAAVAYSLVALHGMPFAAATPIAIAVCALAGLAIEHLALRPLRRRNAPHISTLISTIGLALVVVAVLEQGQPHSPFAWLWVDGANAVRFPAGAIPHPSFGFGGLELDSTKLAMFILSIALMLLLGHLIRSTQLGRALRAVAENPRAASLLGIDIDRIFVFTLVLASALGGLAGILFGIALGDISPYIGRDQVELRGLAVIVLGGMGSVTGAVVAGYLLGLLEVLTIALGHPSLHAGIAFAALFLVLVLRPQGLLGSQAKARV